MRDGRCRVMTGNPPPRSGGGYPRRYPRRSSRLSFASGRGFRSGATAGWPCPISSGHYWSDSVPPMDDHGFQPWVEGPTWSSGPGWRNGGRYPLRVELWLLRQAARLVPGVISTTPIARQYALHSVVASEIDRHNLDDGQARDLLCRSEVVLAAASAAHGDHTPGVRNAHGSPKIQQLLSAGVDLAAAARPGKGQYSENRWGFYGGAYRGPEIQLGIVRTDDRDDRPRPGARSDVPAVRQGLGQVLKLARQPTLSLTEATAVADQLCVCRAHAFDDGRWLAGLLCGADPDNDRRRETIRLLAFGCEERSVVDIDYRNDVDTSLFNLLAFGSLTDEAQRAGLAVAGEWQGTIFRFFMVWAWRRLWADLVNDLEGSPSTVDDLADRLADAVPAETTVAQFLTTLPATTQQGFPVSAEWTVHTDAPNDTVGNLAELMVLARRASELTGAALQSYVGAGSAQYEEFGPRWLAARLNEDASLALPDFARDLAHRLINRAKRVAMDKATVGQDGTLRMNSKFHVTDGLAHLTQPESRTALGLRLAPLASVLAACGVLEVRGGRWRATDGRMLQHG